MSDSSIDTIDPNTFLDELLALPHASAQKQYLGQVGFLTEAGLTRLLQLASQLTRRDPGQAYHLAMICIDCARTIQVHALIPHGQYLQAQVLAVQGKMMESLALIEDAYIGYLTLGEVLHAQRTNLGRMHVLNELGQHQEALNLGQTVLHWLAQHPEFRGMEAQLMTILAHINRGVCFRRIGQYEEALAAYETAESCCQDMELPDRLGDIQNNRGIILLHLGRVSEALTAFTAAAQTRADAGLTHLHAETLINLGEAHLAAGNYTTSLDALRQAYTLLQTVDAAADEHYVILHQADVYLALNLYPEALAAYREAETAFAAAGMAYYQALALWGIGTTLTAQGQVAAALAALTAAAERFREAGNDTLLAGVLLEQAALQAVTHRTQAVDTAQQALTLLAAQDRPIQQVYAHLRLADLLLPDLERADQHLQTAQTLLTNLPLPHLRYRLYQRLGQVRRLQGRNEEAQEWLEAAVAEIERLRRHVAQETMRISFQHDKVSAYTALLQLHLDRGDAAAAFATAEQARSRALVDRVTGAVATTPQPAAAMRLQALQADLNGLYNTFLSPDPVQDVQQRIRSIEQEINSLPLQTQADSLDPFVGTLSPEDIRHALPTDMTLLVYQIIGDEILAFISREHQPITLVRQVSTVTAVYTQLQRLAVQWERFRIGANFVQRHQARLLQSAQQVLGDLYEALIRPLRNHLPVSPGAQLAIIPYGLLHQVPFHALLDGQRYLLDDFVISYAPSATVLALCQQKPTSPVRRSRVTAVADPLIPAVITEAQAVAAHLPGVSIQLDAQATIANLIATNRSTDIWHIACHGLFREDNPLFSALRLHDGWLNATAILNLELPNALVTLSACESGRTQVWAGDEIIGLTRAFLGAGAATLVVSLWIVQDETTAQLMAHWYAQLQQQRYQQRASALRAAQLALREHHPHPYYWASFILVGQS